MPVAVVKLGSSIVAEDTGALRLSVVARICEEVAALHASGVDVVVVTSGAIARGIHLLGLEGRPRAVEELQAASRRRPGPAVPHLRRVPARARHPVRPGAADVLRHERPHALPQRAPDAAQARRLADRAGHQRERHDHHRRDLLRRQRLPRRPGRRARRRLAAAAADLDARAPDRRSARRPFGASWSRSSPTPPSSTRSRSAPRPRRWDRAACARRSPPPRWPPPPASRPSSAPASSRDCSAAPGRGRRPAPASPRTPSASPPSSSGCATPSPPRAASSSTPAPPAPCATAAPPCCRSASSAWTAASRPATRSRSAIDGETVGKGISNYSAGELRRVMGLKSAEVRSVLPRAVEEAVHRDYFVLV